MPALTRRRLLLEHADRIEAHGAGAARTRSAWPPRGSRRPASADPELLVRAARLARYGQDFTQVERLGRAALLEGVTPEAGLLVGEALHELGAFAEADEVLHRGRGSGRPTTTPCSCRSSRSAPATSCGGCSRYDEALEVNRAARDRLERPAGVEELTLNEAMLLTYSGRPARHARRPRAGGPASRSRERALRALAEVPALVAIGRCGTAVEDAAPAFAEQTRRCPTRSPSPAPGCTSSRRSTRWPSAAGSPRPRPWPPAAYEATPPTAPPDAFMWFAQQQGRCALLPGRSRRPAGGSARPLARCEEHALVGPRRLVLSDPRHGGCVCRATSDRGRGRVVELDAAPSLRLRPGRTGAGPGLGARRAGDLPAARGGIRDAAELRRSAGYRRSEAWLLHDVVRLGDPASVVGRLEELADDCEGGSSPRTPRTPRRPLGRTEGLGRRGRPVRADRRAAAGRRGGDRGRAGAAAGGDRRGVSGDRACGPRRWPRRAKGRARRPSPSP